MVTVHVYVTLKPSLLDSAGRTVHASLDKLGYHEIQTVRVGKMIELQMEEFDAGRVQEMCDRLLANPVTEDVKFEIVQ